MDRCALFVDAGYLLADGAMAAHGTRRREAASWDFAGLLQLLGGLARERTGLPLLRCYWYEATVEGRRGPEHDALADLPGIKLRLSRIRPGRREGVDGEIHRDLMTLARNRGVADAVVVSGDEDLAQVVADAQDLGVRVTVVHVAVDGNWTISRVLRQECDDLIEIGSSQLRPYVNLLSGAPASPALSANGQSRGAGGALTPLPAPGRHGGPPTLTPLIVPPSASSGSAPISISAPTATSSPSMPSMPSSSSPSSLSGPADPDGFVDVSVARAGAGPRASSSPLGRHAGSVGPATSPAALPAPSPPMHSAPTSGSSQSSGTPQSANGSGPLYPQQPVGPYTGPQQITPTSVQQSAPTLADAVKAAHQEGQDFGESVARDAPALWLEAVLARKPRMPSDLEARLLQGSSLPIDFLLHDEVRHALRRGFWDALERSRRN